MALLERKREKEKKRKEGRKEGRRERKEEGRKEEDVWELIFCKHFVNSQKTECKM